MKRLILALALYCACVSLAQAQIYNPPQMPAWASTTNPATVRTNLGLGPLATATNVASPLTISNSLLGVTVGTNGVVGFSFSAPVATNSMGVPGQVFFSTNYLYICVGSNEWRRVLLGTW